MTITGVASGESPTEENLEIDEGFSDDSDDSSSEDYNRNSSASRKDTSSKEMMISDLHLENV